MGLRVSQEQIDKAQCDWGVQGARDESERGRQIPAAPTAMRGLGLIPRAMGGDWWSEGSRET